MLDHLKNQRGDVPQGFSLALSDLQNGVPYKKNKRRFFMPVIMNQLKYSTAGPFTRVQKKVLLAKASKDSLQLREKLPRVHTTDGAVSQVG